MTATKSPKSPHPPSLVFFINQLVVQHRKILFFLVGGVLIYGNQHFGWSFTDADIEHLVDAAILVITGAGVYQLPNRSRPGDK